MSRLRVSNAAPPESWRARNSKKKTVGVYNVCHVSVDLVFVKSGIVERFSGFVRAFVRANWWAIRLFHNLVLPAYGLASLRDSKIFSIMRLICGYDCRFAKVCPFRWEEYLTYVNDSDVESPITHFYEKYGRHQHVWVNSYAESIDWFYEVLVVGDFDFVVPAEVPPGHPPEWKVNSRVLMDLDFQEVCDNLGFGCFRIPVEVRAQDPQLRMQSMGVVSLLCALLFFVATF